MNRLKQLELHVELKSINDWLKAVECWGEVSVGDYAAEIEEAMERKHQIEMELDVKYCRHKNSETIELVGIDETISVCHDCGAEV